MFQTDTRLTHRGLRSVRQREGLSKYEASALKEAGGVYRKAAVESGEVIIQLLCMQSPTLQPAYTHTSQPSVSLHKPSYSSRAAAIS